MNKLVINTLLVVGVLIAAGSGLYLGLGMRETLQPTEVRYEELLPNELLAPGEQFPGVPLMAHDSTIHNTSELLAGGGVVIFMEIGCPPCSVMSENWDQAIDVWESHPTVFGISSASLDRITAYREHLGLQFPVYSDTGAVFETAFQVVDFPFQLVVDRSGAIRHTTYDSRQDIDTTMIASLLVPDTSDEATSH